MLITDFYTLEEFTLTDKAISAIIHLNPDHDVYKGHFPNQPVLPGVIQLQIIKELMEKGLSKKLLLSEMAFAKFLKMVIPELSQKLSITIDFKTNGKTTSFTAKIEDEATVFTKVKGVFSSN